MPPLCPLGGSSPTYCNQSQPALPCPPETKEGESMHFSRAAATLALAAATIAVALVAGPAGAVLNGTADTANRFSNVGSLQLKVGNDWFQFCSGTLVRPNVVLTAAHCTDFLVDVGADGFGPDDVRITFDPEQDGPYY